MIAQSSQTLVLAPRGRDGELAVQLLARHDLEAVECGSGQELVARMTEGAGCAIVTEEALEPSLQRQLAACLHGQPPWSDFPFVVLATANAAQHLQAIINALGNVTVIERPVAPDTLITAVRAALRGRHRQYEAGAAIQQRDEFLAMLGHELRTPLGAIVLATELARDPRDRAPTEERLALIARQSKLLARLVDDLLDVARVTSGKIVLRKEAIDVDVAIAACAKTHGEGARARRMEVAIDSTSGAIVDADPARLEQIINNLLANAIKYSPAGRTVHVGSVIREGQCEIHVRDHGIGIAPDMQGRIFELFQQVDGSLSRAEGGLGIGLTLVDRLVRLHAGSVRLESEGLGHGSEFIVTLPLSATAAKAEAQPDPARQAAPTHVALVEDNADLREMTATLLEAHGCAVDVAADGPDGIEIIVQGHPDLALVDIGLPTVDGFEVARQVRTLLGDEVMLVAITGYGRAQDRQHAVEAGFDAFFTKPLSLDSLRDILGRARNREHNHRAAR